MDRIVVVDYHTKGEVKLEGSLVFDEEPSLEQVSYALANEYKDVMGIMHFEKYEDKIICYSIQGVLDIVIKIEELKLYKV